MTGPAEGKIRIDATVFMNSKQIDADVYIHLKGKALARVTHLDIESHELNILQPKTGGFFNIYSTGKGLKIVVYNHTVFVNSVLLKDIVHRFTRTWVGGKQDGIYIGFKKTEIIKLESIAEQIVQCTNY
jgi:hypothetical protein